VPCLIWVKPRHKAGLLPRLVLDRQSGRSIATAVILTAMPDSSGPSRPEGA